MLTAFTIKARAAELGFDACGIAPAAAFPELRYLREWLASGYGGELRFVSRSVKRREDVRAVLPSARSVIVLGTVYNVDRPYSTEAADPDVARIARYAWGDDYHTVILSRMDALLAWMRDVHPEPFDARTCVDTGPVQERVYAQYGGIGWIGKNTCLINADLGSWLFLSEIICSLPLAPDAPGLDRCGTCTLCLDACPTDALREPWKLDATRCLSYQTIELKGAIPEQARPGIGSHVYGCDVCQEVCPWNSAPAVSHDPAWMPRPAFDAPGLVELWERSDHDLRLALEGSAMQRAGLRGLRRNIAVALGNAAPEGAARALEHEDPDRLGTCSDPLVAEHVSWAKSRVGRRG